MEPTIDWRSIARTDLPDLITSRDNYINAIHDATRSMEHYEQDQEAREEALRYLEAFVGTNAAIQELSRECSYRIRAYDQEIGEIRSRIARYADLVAQRNREIEELSAQTVSDTQQTLAQIREALAGNPHIRPSTIAIDSDENSVTWVFQKVLMTPDENPYPAIKGSMRIKLPNIRVRLYLNTRDFKMTAASDTVNNYLRRGIEGLKVAHPHILSDHKPCLGDFYGPIMEAIDAQDIALIADLLLMFLQQANNSDAAGQHWPNWIIFPGRPPRLRPPLARENPYALCIEGMYYTIHLDDDGNATLQPAHSDGTYREPPPTQILEPIAFEVVPGPEPDPSAVEQPDEIEAIFQELTNE